MSVDSPRTPISIDRLDVQVSASVGSIDVVTVRKGLTAVTKPSRETAWRGPARFAARIQESLVQLHELVAARHTAPGLPGVFTQPLAEAHENVMKSKRLFAEYVMPRLRHINATPVMDEQGEHAARQPSTV